jgi:hypothetical protein
MRPVIALVTVGVAMDVMGIEAHPRTAHFKEDIIRLSTGA